MEKKQLTIRLEPEVKETLKLICNIKGISINEYINQLLKDKFKTIDPATIKEIQKLKDI